MQGAIRHFHLAKPTLVIGRIIFLVQFLAPPLGTAECGRSTEKLSRGDQVEPPASLDAPMISPPGVSSKTATSSPSGNCSLIRSSVPDHWPTVRIDLTILAWASVLPPFSPRPIAVVWSRSNPI